MTKVQVQYEFSSPFKEGWTESIEALHSVYGMQNVKLNPKLDGLQITYDASRLKLTDVERHLQRSGLPVRRLEA